MSLDGQFITFMASILQQQETYEIWEPKEKDNLEPPSCEHFDSLYLIVLWREKQSKTREKRAFAV